MLPEEPRFCAFDGSGFRVCGAHTIDNSGQKVDRSLPRAPLATVGLSFCLVVTAATDRGKVSTG
jgi:hypothetical protein